MGYSFIDKVAPVFQGDQERFNADVSEFLNHLKENSNFNINLLSKSAGTVEGDSDGNNKETE